MNVAPNMNVLWSDISAVPSVIVMGMEQVTLDVNVINATTLSKPGKVDIPKASMTIGVNHVLSLIVNEARAPNVMSRRVSEEKAPGVQDLTATNCLELNDTTMTFVLHGHIPVSPVFPACTPGSTTFQCLALFRERCDHSGDGGWESFRRDGHRPPSPSSVTSPPRIETRMHC